jgi:hypothetical protein
MSDDGDLDLDCAICGQSAALTDRSPVQIEHALDVWCRLHEHTAVERMTWYRIAMDEDA